MKRLSRLTAIVVAAVFLLPQGVEAATGDLGFAGGISEGTRLPKATEELLQIDTARQSMPYKELVFLTGAKIEFEGLLEKRASGGIDETLPSGTYTESYTTRVKPNATGNEPANVVRAITYDVNWRKNGNQYIKDYEPRTWRETITADGTDYELLPDFSHSSVSIIEDRTPGVTYYKGNISQRAVYDTGAGDGATVTVEMSGTIYGYSSAWSSTETHRLDYYVDNGDWQMQYQVRPSVSVNKVLQYSQNEPTAISFPGNYREVMQNRSALQYDIFMNPQQFYTEPLAGGAIVDSNNTFEQLIAPDLGFLKGNAAEDDIKKLFAMQVIESDPKKYIPNQAVTRGEFMTMLVKAIKLPTETQAATGRGRARQVEVIVFPDISTDREEYPYIMAAYRAGLAVGKDHGYFYIDSPISRQEAIVYLMRAIGLETLGLDPTPVTSFVDDAKVASWAKKEVYAANRIGLIYPDGNGNITPEANVSKAEAAALMNRLIDYMRINLQIDYTENIVNYSL